MIQVKSAESDSNASSDPDEDVREYSTADGQSLTMVASLLDVSLSALLRLNQRRYSGLTARSKLKAGTSVLLPAPSTVDGDVARSTHITDPANIHHSCRNIEHTANVF